MRMRMRPTARFLQKCTICGSDPHKDDCPIEYRRVLREADCRIRCPLCQAYAVGVNQSDLYECRDCHEQFSTGGYHETADAKPYFIDPPASVEPVRVVHLDKKGDGNFPIDKKLAEVQEQIDRLRAGKSQQREKE